MYDLAGQFIADIVAFERERLRFTEVECAAHIAQNLILSMFNLKN